MHGDLSDLEKSVFRDINEEETCVKKCLEIENCSAITFVDGRINDDGCYLKSKGWTVKEQANTVSVNVDCVRAALRGKKNVRI